MAKKKIQEVVEDYFREAPEEIKRDYSLYDVEYVKEGADYYLRIYIDKNGEGYIGTEDCETVSRSLSEWLDKEDPIEQNYYLEVSSPGLDRVIRKAEHFARYMGEEVALSLYKPVNGEKKITGVLKSYENEEVSIETGDGEVSAFPLKDIAKVNLVYNWDEKE